MVEQPEKRGMSERQSHFLVRFITAFLVLSILASLWTGFEGYRKRLNMGYYKEELSLPPSEGFARYEIAGYRFNVPIRYHYMVYQMRGNRWISDSDRVQKVGGGITFDLFMPDLKTYDAEVQEWSFNERNNKHIRIMLAQTDAVQTPEAALKNYGARLQEVPQRVSGLKEFGDSLSKRHYFIQYPQKDSYYWMICDSRCSVRVTYQEYPQLILSYHFGMEYLPEWDRINNRIKQSLDEFLVARPDVYKDK